MGDRALRRSLPLYAKPAEKPPEGRLPLPRGYSIYALRAQTGLRGSDRRAVRGPPHPSRQSPSTVPRRLLVLVVVASDEIYGLKGGSGLRGSIGPIGLIGPILRVKLRYGDLFGEINVLNRIEQFHAFAHGTLEGFATRDQTHAAA